MIKTNVNLSLRWGEWLGVALTSTAASAVVIEAILVAWSTAWFGDPNRVLISLVQLSATIFVAALVMRLVDLIPGLQRLNALVIVLGTTLTALALIRIRVFPQVPPGDFSWLAALNDLFDPYREQPHTILGLILVSIIAWTLGNGLAHHGGDYDQRRAHFTGFFFLLLFALFIAAGITVHRDILNAQLVLAVPTYAVLSLLTLGQVRLAEVRDRLRRTGGGEPRQLLLWRLTSWGIALASVILVYIAVAIFSSESYAGPLKVIGTLWSGLVDIIVGILAIPFTPLIDFLYFIYNAIMKAIFAGSTSVNFCPTPVPGITPTPMPTPVLGASVAASCVPPRQPIIVTVPPPSDAQLHAIYVVVVILVLCIGVLILLARLARRLASQSSDTFTEVRERIIGQEPEPALMAPFQPAFDAPPPGSVRAAYRDLLRTGDGVGYTRQRDETAAEYAQRLRQADAPEAPLAALTEAYEQERYGEVSASPTRFAAALDALRRLTTFLRPPPHR